jgi:hypothetical protein
MLVGGEGVVLVFGIDVDFLVGISEITVLGFVLLMFFLWWVKF